MNEAILCLAIAVFREARGEPLKAQYMVAEVIDNRTKHPSFPSNYCDVIKQKNQFSFYKSSKDLKPPKYELEAWEQSKQVAKNFSKNKTNYTKNAIFFNRSNLGVRYKVTTTNGRPCKVGNHIFY